MPPPGAPPKSPRPSAPFRNLALAGVLLLGGARLPAAAGDPPTVMERPEGTITAQAVHLEAPDAACAAYLETFATRTWHVPLASPDAFEARLRAAGLSAATIAALTDMELWAPATEGRGFTIRPTAALLAQLPEAERRALYRLLAHWKANRPERWPLVFADEPAFHRLAAAGVEPALIARVRALCYRFTGGWAFSDFSVVAAEFPDRERLLRFLAATSAVDTTIPRLRIHRAASIAQVLDYWTASTRNPYTLPLLEALQEADLPDGVDLATILPGASRELSYNLDPADLPRDISLVSFIISSSLALPPKPLPDINAFLQRLDDEYTAARPPERFGDLLVLQYPGEVVAPYACAYVVGGLVFARDPVGLGLWRFMSPEEILRRNPHFEGARFELRRVRSTPPATPPAP